MKSSYDAVIFDLDGTLIDSSASILAGFAAALDREGLAPSEPLSAGIIGPPLRDTLSRLAGSDEAGLLDRLAEGFKAYYDTVGFTRSEVFPGINTMLEAVALTDRPLHIATNKRLLPTVRILEHLGWSHRFGRVAALDAWTPPARDKSDMLRRLTRELDLVPARCLYVGDREEDAVAAAGNGLAFAFAAWGYGTAPKLPGVSPLAQPDDLVILLNSR